MRQARRRGHRPPLTRRQFPLAYAYPKERSGLRDLLRARLRLVRQRAELYGHVHTARRQANLPPVSNDVKYKSKRMGIVDDIADPFVRRRVETQLALLDPLDATIRRLEADIEDAAQEHYSTELAVLQSTPGVGPVLSLTILLEIDAIERFDTRQQFCSYARLCGAVQESAGKRSGVGNRKAGNAWLKWAFSEAAVLSLRRTNASASSWTGWRRGWASPRRTRRWPTSWAGRFITCSIPRRSLTSTVS